ncbi:MAG: hypothetical protein E7624_01005 [Ruminococcaceae bacterium]|nr:hypothetical protein [Oscillospiraceae bacterium]
MAYINCRIVFGKDDFTYKTFWGVKHTVQYKDLTAIRGKNKDIKLFAGKRVIRVDEGAINGKRFVLYARQQYKRHHNGMAIPQIAKKDLFNNHVENPGEFIFIYAILTVAFLGMTVLIVCLTIPENETEFVPKAVVAGTYEVSEETLVISDPAGTAYHIWDYDALLVESAGFFEKLDSKTELRLLVKYNEKADEPYYIVSSIEAEGKQYLSFDAWYKNEWKDTVPVFAMVFFLDLLMLAFTWLSIYVGRNPHKFSDRVLHMFYKPGYIHRD